MPIEVRRIEYTEVELRNALSLYQTKTTGGSAVSHIRVTDGDVFSVVAKVTNEEGETIHKVFEEDTVVAMMVLYSKEHFIPLPKKGRKGMTATEFNGVTMSVKYLHDVCKSEREALMPMKPQ